MYTFTVVGCKVKAVPDMSGLSGLTSLTVAECGVSEVTCVLPGSTGTLSLRQNKLEEFPIKAVAFLDRLAALDLSQNDILSLPPSLEGAFLALHTLDLSYNALCVFPDRNYGEANRGKEKC